MRRVRCRLATLFARRNAFIVALLGLLLASSPIPVFADSKIVELVNGEYSKTTSHVHDEGLQQSFCEGTIYGVYLKTGLYDQYPAVNLRRTRA